MQVKAFFLSECHALHKNLIEVSRLCSKLDRREAPFVPWRRFGQVDEPEVIVHLSHELCADSPPGIGNVPGGEQA